MLRENANDLLAFIAVAEERSFTKAAARIGVSQSALSHTMRGLEARLGVRLLTRTTRAVAPTEAGERLLARIRPAFAEIHDELQSLADFRDRPAGRFRITAGQHPIETVLWPRLAPLLAAHPDIKVEFSADGALRDIVSDRFDAGVRLGEQVAVGMIAVRIGPDMRMAVVGAPSYFERHAIPRSPRDLTEHACINLRLPTLGGLYAWEFEEDGREFRVRVDGQLTFNTTGPMLRAAIDGHGLACTLEDIAREGIETGRLVRVLEAWCPPFPGYHLYYPSRRQTSPAFGMIVDALRYRG